MALHQISSCEEYESIYKKTDPTLSSDHCRLLSSNCLIYCFLIALGPQCNSTSLTDMGNALVRFKKETFYGTKKRRGLRGNCHKKRQLKMQFISMGTGSRELSLDRFVLSQIDFQACYIL